MMLRDEKISRAKAKLLADYPFFGTLASRLEVVLNDDIQAFTSDGIKLEYNSDFLDEVSVEELEFVFANGAMHASLEYESRQNNRSNWLWQLSRDYAINDMLVENGLERPWQANYSERFSGLYAEEIYAELQADIIRDADELPPEDGDDAQSEDNVDSRVKPENDEKVKPENDEKVKPENDEKVKPENDEKVNPVNDEKVKPEDDHSVILSLTGNLNEQLFEEFTKSTLEKEEKNAELPASLERFFNIDFSSKYDWREELRDAIDRFAKDDYKQMPPNKKFLSQGIYLPSTTSETFHLVIAIDSSGSVDDELLDEFLSEINALMLSIPKYQIEILVCDYKIRLHKVFYSGEPLDIEIIGGGTTDFRPVFEFIEENFFDIKLLVYFTDLDGIYPKEMPNFDVKWISPYSNTI